MNLDTSKVVYLPFPYINGIENKTILVFGGRNIEVNVQPLSALSRQMYCADATDAVAATTDATADGADPGAITNAYADGADPGAIANAYVENSDADANPHVLFHQSVIDELLIPKDLSYQLLTESSTLKLGPVVGLLLGKQYIYYNDVNMAEYTDALSVYKKVGGLFFAFTPEGIDWDNKTIYGLYYNGRSHWNYGVFPYPSVIFRRGFQDNEMIVEKIKQSVCNNVFNSIKLSKWETHCLLAEDDKLLNILPDTCMIQSCKVVSEYLAKYKSVILKPTDLSRGRGIFIMREIKSGIIEVTNCMKDDNQTSFLLSNDLNHFLTMRGFLKRPYIVQNRLELACVNGNPFDIRVVMHKNQNNKWNCSGIECRIAGADNMISNIARGGRALSISRTLLLAFGPSVNARAIKKKVINLAMDICRHIEDTGEWYIELGLDLAIDACGKIWFIEANTRPSFKGFKTLDLKNYIHICNSPINYAVAASGFRN